ncbi:MAG: acyloxyacyl hydrolase [Chitinophagaceae bacterium]
MRHWLPVILLCLFFSFPVLGQPGTNSGKTQHRVYGFSFLSGPVLVHNHLVESIENARTHAVSFEISKQMTDSVSYSFCRAYVRKGFSFSYFDFGTPILGYGLISSYFLEPVYRVGNKLQLQFRGDMGAGYFSNPFDSSKNPTNKNYSQHITPYLRISAGFGIRLTQKLTLEGNAGLHHISNGNYREPNAGLNWLSLSATLLYYPGNNLFPHYKRPSRYKWNEKKGSLDIGLMYVPKQGYHLKWNNTRNYMIGLFAVATKKVSHISAVSGGVEFCYNKFTPDPVPILHNCSPGVVAGVMIGHEFLLNKIIFSQQCGIYFTNYPSFYKSVYHRWGLRYRLTKKLYAGFNMKVHRFTADFIDLRIQYKLF